MPNWLRVRYGITFESTDRGMKATLVTDGGTFFAGKRIEEPHLNAVELAAYAGLYNSTELDATYDLSIDKGRLLLRSRWNRPQELTAVAPDEFESGDFGTVVFRRDANHCVSGLSVFTVNARDVKFERSMEGR